MKKYGTLPDGKLMEEKTYCKELTRQQDQLCRDAGIHFDHSADALWKKIMWVIIGIAALLAAVQLQAQQNPHSVPNPYLDTPADTNQPAGQVPIGKTPGGEQVFDTVAETIAKAKDGNAVAQFNVGASYDLGQNNYPQNSAEAVVWYLKSAKQGYAVAQNNLGVCYATGSGVAQDNTEAVRWYFRAAEQGLSASQSALGSCYGNGEGVPKDYVEAYKWLDLSLAQGNEVAKTNLSIIERVMTTEQIAAAQKLVRDFRPQTESSSESSLSTGSPKASGTGFFITDDGYLITNYHVIKDAAQVRLVTSAGVIDARVIRVDTANDLAMLKANVVPQGEAGLPIAASRTINLGATVATVGFPDIGLQGYSPKLAKGEIASLSGAGDDPCYFQISVPVQPGNSGGALVDEHGNVVGIVAAKLSAQAALDASGQLPENVNYAVKSSLLLSFLESVPEVSVKLKAPISGEQKFDDVVRSAQSASVLVLVY